jgi:rhodanese-related sulfurtransferase
MMKYFVFLFIFMGISAANGAEPLLLAADAAYQRARSGKLTLIDIRSPSEWRQTGVPKAAIAVTMHDSKGVDAFYANVLAAVDRDKSRLIALICAAGNRSRWAQGFLAEKGFQNIRNVSEGMFGNGKLPGWLARGLPVTSR